MGAKAYSFVSVMLLLSIGIASASPLSTFLSSFNVSSSVQNALTYTNISYNGGTYLLAYYNNAPYFLLNSTSGFSFVLNTASIAPIITSTIVQSSLSQINSTYLSNSMYAYNQSSAKPLLDCITETGLNQPNASCTSTNFCESCRTVPVCSQVLSNVGYGSPFQTGIEMLQANYSALISNLNAYNAAVTQLKSSSTAQQGLVRLQSSFTNISTITQNMYQNPVFPPPQNANYGVCANYGAVTGTFNPKSSNWFCAALGFCQFLTYNYTALNNIQSYINKVSALPMSSTQISSIAQQVSNNGGKYALVILDKQKLQQKNHILNTTLLGYNSVSSGASSLLLSIANASLSTKFSTLNSNYSLLQNSYNTANLVALNVTLAKQYNALKTLYLQLNGTYYGALRLSQNNTAMLLSLESESKTPGAQVVALSFQEATLNSQLSSKPSNINMVYANLSRLNSQIKSAPHSEPILSAVSRSVGVPFASVLLGSNSFASETANAPLVAIIPSILISLVVLAALYLLYKRLHKHGRIRHGHSTNKNWKILFGIVILLLLIYVYESYSAAASANSSASLSDAAYAIGNAKSVAIAINGTSNTYLVSCENKIAGILAGQSKTVNRITFNGQACSAGSGIQTTDECLGHYIATGVPVIILTNSSRNTLTAYSFYGTVLSQSGNQQFTNACLASLFLG